jgi:WD40 repeat protein
VIKTFDSQETEFLDIKLNPNDDTFVSVNSNGVLKVFDLGAHDQEPLAVFDIRDDQKFPEETVIHVCGNFDSTGVVLAISIYIEEAQAGGKVSTSNRVDLFDVKKYEEGRFDSWKLDNFARITMIKFSNNSYYILAYTVKGELLILDAFEGSLIRKFSTGGTANIEPSFTPDSKFVLSGSDMGTIFIFDIENNKEVARLEGHVKPSGFCKFSPTSVMMASACQNILFWLPKYWD